MGHSGPAPAKPTSSEGRAEAGKTEEEGRTVPKLVSHLVQWDTMKIRKKVLRLRPQTTRASQKGQLVE